MATTGTCSALALAALAACADPCPGLETPAGACVDLQGVPPDLVSDLWRAEAAGLAWWGPGDLSGWRVEFRPVLEGGADGLTWWRDRLIQVRPGDPRCAEDFAWVLPHEIGHALHGDPDHLDPRWLKESAVLESMLSRCDP